MGARGAEMQEGTNDPVGVPTTLVDTRLAQRSAILAPAGGARTTRTSTAIGRAARVIGRDMRASATESGTDGRAGRAALLGQDYEVGERGATRRSAATLDRAPSTSPGPIPPYARVSAAG